MRKQVIERKSLAIVSAQQLQICILTHTSFDDSPAQHTSTASCLSSHKPIEPRPICLRNPGPHNHNSTKYATPPPDSLAPTNPYRRQVHFCPPACLLHVSPTPQLKQTSTQATVPTAMHINLQEQSAPRHNLASHRAAPETTNTHMSVSEVRPLNTVSGRLLNRLLWTSLDAQKSGGAEGGCRP